MRLLYAHRSLSQIMSSYSSVLHIIQIQVLRDPKKVNTNIALSVRNSKFKFLLNSNLPDVPNVDNINIAHLIQIVGQFKILEDP